MTTERTTRVVTMSQILVSGDLDDFVAGPPPWANPELIQIDRDAAAGGQCLNCGARSLEFRAFHNPHPHSRAYRVFTRCAVCFAVEEM